MANSELVVADGAAVTSTPPLEVISSKALDTMTRAELDSAVATAKRYPRSLSAFKERAIAMATLDVETAESCFYALPRDGKVIEGESVRLAEICAAAYGNLRVLGRIVDEDQHFIVAMGLCADLEANVVYQVEVRRRITDRYGRRYKPDMIATTGNAAVSIAVRNAIFRAIPKAYVRPAYLAAKKVAVGDEKTLAVRRQAAVAYFVGQGVSKERIFAALGKSGLEDLDLAALETLTGIKTAVKDGELSLEVAFPEPEAAVETPGEDRASALAAKVRARKKDAADPLPEPGTAG